MSSQLLRCKLGLTTSHGVSSPKSLKYDIDAYMTTIFGDEVWDLCQKLDQTQKLEPAVNTSPANFFAYNDQDPTLILINHIWMMSWSSTVGTLPPCRDLVTRSGPGTLGPVWTGPKNHFVRLLVGVDGLIAKQSHAYKDGYASRSQKGEAKEETMMDERCL